ncbi:9758_t:CDS:1, partial [Funneliformis caledonium]
EYPSSYYLKEGTSTAQISTTKIQMNSISEKELLEKFKQFTNLQNAMN